MTQTISDRRPPVESPDEQCSFCHKPAEDVLILIQSNDKNSHICDECVLVCVKLFLSRGRDEQ